MVSSQLESWRMEPVISAVVLLRTTNVLLSLASTVSQWWVSRSPASGCPHEGLQQSVVLRSTNSPSPGTGTDSWNKIDCEKRFTLNNYKHYNMAWVGIIHNAKCWIAMSQFARRRIKESFRKSIISIDSRIPDVFSLISRLVGSLNQSWDLMDNF